jgi:hypothetical protein
MDAVFPNYLRMLVLVSLKFSSAVFVISALGYSEGFLLAWLGLWWIRGLP